MKTIPEEPMMREIILSSPHLKVIIPLEDDEHDGLLRNFTKQGIPSHVHN